MNLTIELYPCDESGAPLSGTVPDASLPADATFDVRLARTLELVRGRLPRAVEAGDIVVVDGTRYFVTTRGFRAVPADYRPTLGDLLVGFPSVRADAR
jgi:hypothetical protein